MISKLIKLAPGTWSRAGQIPCQFNSYLFLILISLTLSYTTKTAWALRFISNKIYEDLNTIDTKTLVQSPLIWSRAGSGSITESKKVNRKFQGEPQSEVAANPRREKVIQINVCIANKQMHDKHKDQLPLPHARWSKC